MTRQLLALVFILLSACAKDATVRVNSESLVGTYYSGDGLGRLVYVTLSPDGKYKAEWSGCLGLYGESDGEWEVQGDQILFVPAQEQDLLAGYLRSATTVSHEGSLGFARAEDVENEKIESDLLFLRVDGGK